MKRGLKQGLVHTLELRDRGCIDCPDEEGTETGSIVALDANGFGCIDCPDEEGTETRLEADRKQIKNFVALIAPMKRGLKL